MGFGGPVWHCSVSSQTIFTSDVVREAMAREILEGFGDPEKGEWTESRRVAFHLRRRLSVSEQERVGEAVDYRTGEEGTKRLERMAAFLPPQAVTLAMEELLAWKLAEELLFDEG